MKPAHRYDGLDAGWREDGRSALQMQEYVTRYTIPRSAKLTVSLPATTK